MPRTPQVRYFASRRAYYTQHRGRQVLLASGPKDGPEGPTYLAALQAFASLMTRRGDVQCDDSRPLSGLLGDYLAHLKEKGAGHKRALCYLQSAMEQLGHLQVKGLTTRHVGEWLTSRKTWGDTTIKKAADRLCASLNWAVDRGEISKNPVALRKLRLAPERSRGRECVLSAGEMSTLEQRANPRLGELLAFLRQTGCRPGEAYHLEAKHVCSAQHLIRYRHDAPPGEFRHKNARKTRKDRVIYLGPQTAALVALLTARHPTSGGLLFRNTIGRRWTNGSVSVALKRLGTHAIAYSYRHTFATRWLLNGGSIKVLADLIGTSIAMIERHYGHLDADPERMRELLGKFSGQQQGDTPADPIGTVSPCHPVILSPCAGEGV
jgi:integrase